jgi:hypothetical protein
MMQKPKKRQKRDKKGQTLFHLTGTLGAATLLPLRHATLHAKPKTKLNFTFLPMMQKPKKRQKGTDPFSLDWNLWGCNIAPVAPHHAPRQTKNQTHIHLSASDPQTASPSKTASHECS